MRYHKNYTVLKPKIPWAFKLSAFVFVLSIIGIILPSVFLESDPILKKKLFNIFMLLLPVSGSLAVILFFIRASKNSLQDFIDTFARHIGFQYGGSSSDIARKISKYFDPFEEKRVKALSKIGFLYDSLLGKGTLTGKFSPHSIFYVERKDYQVYFSGLITNHHRYATYKSCCVIRDKKFNFPDFTLKSKGRLSRFIEYLTGSKNPFYVDGPDKEEGEKFFSSLELDPKILSHTGNITIEGQNGVLLIVCDAGLSLETMGELYGVWNEIYRLFYVYSTGEEPPEEKKVKKSAEKKIKKEKNKSGTRKEVPNYPSQIKLELDTPLEDFLEYGIYIGFIATLGMLFYYLKNGIPLDKSLLINMLTGLSFIGICSFCRKRVDNYYILDSDSQYLIYHFQFLGFKKISNYAHFSEVHAVTVEGQAHGGLSRHEAGWNYRVAIVLASQKKLPISNPAHNAFAEQKKEAKKIAQIIGANFIDGGIEKVAQAKLGDDGRCTFEHRNYSFLKDSPIYFALVSIPLFIIFALVLLVPLTAILKLLFG